MDIKFPYSLLKTNNFLVEPKRLIGDLISCSFSSIICFVQANITNMRCKHTQSYDYILLYVKIKITCFTY